MAFERTFLHLKAIIDAETRGLHEAFAGARKDARDTADYIDRQRGDIEIGADTSDLERGAKRATAIRQEIERKKAVLEVEVDVDDSELDALTQKLKAAEAQERRMWKAHAQSAAALDDAAGAQRRMNVEVERGRRSILASIMGWGRFTKNLSDMRIQLGVASVSMRGFIVLLGTMGPLITSLVGTLSALVGVLGAGIVGAAAVGGAGLTGLALGAFGLVQALEGADKRMKAMGKDWAKLRENFQGRTGAARDSFFDLMASGLARAKALMPDFAKQTNAFSAALKSAGDNFLSAFSGAEMRSAMNAIMGNLSDALPTLGEALGNVAEGLANIFASASRHFEPIAEGLLKWSEGFSKANEAGSALDSKIDKLMSSAESLVHFFASAGRLMATFFGAGADEGAGLLDDLTEGMDRLNDELQTAEGQAGLNEFFSESITMAKDLFQAIKDIASVFMELSDAMAPVVDAALKIVEAFADIVDFAADLPLVGDAFKGMLTGIGALMGVGLISGAIGRTLKLAAAGAGALGLRLKGLPPVMNTTVQGTTKVAKGMDNVTRAQRAATAGTGRFAQAATRVSPQLGVAASRATATGSAFRGMGLKGGLAAAAVVAIGDELGLFTQESKYSEEELKELNSALQRSAGAMDDTAISARGARQLLIQLGPAFRQGGGAAKSAMVDVRNYAKSMRDEAQALRQDAGFLFGEGPGEVPAGGDYTGIWKSLRDAFDEVEGIADEDLIPTFKSLGASIKENGKLTNDWENRLRNLGATDQDIRTLRGSVSDYTKLMGQARVQTRQAELAIVNAARAGEGLKQLPRAMGGAFGAFAKTVGRKQAIEWAVKVDDRQALGKIMQLSNRLRGMGARDTVTRILANSKNAEEALRRLEAAKARVKRPVTVHAKDAASNVIKGVQGLLDRHPKKKNTNLEAKNNASSQAKAAKSDIDNIPRRHDTDIDGDASSAIAAAVAAVHAINAMRAVIQVAAAVNTAGAKPRAQGGPLTGYATGGGFIQKPMFIAGEEAPRFPEFVIATNPIYKQANLGYWEAAGRMLGVPGFAAGGVYTSGAVPPDAAQASYDSSRERYQKAKEREKKLQEKLDDMRKRNSNRDRKDDVPASALEAAERDHRRAERDLKAAQRRMARDRANLRATQAAHNKREGQEKEINYDQAEMDSARARGDSAGFENWKEELLDDIRRLLSNLKPAARKATGQYKTELLTRIAELETLRERTLRDSMGAEGMLSGAETAQLERLQGMIAYAATTATPTDDIEGNRALVSFWEGILAKHTQGPQSGWNWAAVTEASQNLTAAREAALGSGAAGGIIGAGQVFSNARMDLYRQFGSNVIWKDAAVAQPSGGGATVNNYFSQPPPDPHSWAEQQAWELQTL